MQTFKTRGFEGKALEVSDEGCKEDHQADVEDQKDLVPVSMANDFVQVVDFDFLD